MPSALRVVGVGSIDPLQSRSRFTWIVDHGAAYNYRRLGELLAKGGDLYRNGERHGLILALPSGETRLLIRAKDLLPVIVDRVRMRVVKEGKLQRETPTAEHLGAMLASETFLRQFGGVDVVAKLPVYLDDFSIAKPGFNDGTPGQRILYLGQVPPVAKSAKTIEQFLDVVPFASNADRTNAVAAALTLQLRRLWPGQKPVVLLTSTRSHSGKTTITDFICGQTPRADILYESTDWPMQRELHQKLTENPDIGAIVLDNVRLDSAGGKAKCIRSAFFEGLVTSPQVHLAPAGARETFWSANHFLAVINTNDGSVSIDLLNRGLPIHLAPREDVHLKTTPIGNPRLDFLPANREYIAGELRGMIARWKAAGCPVDDSVRHSMSPWAKVIGGILRHAGFRDFLANCEGRKTADEPVRAAIGMLGAAAPGKPLRPKKWAQLAVTLGLAQVLLTSADRNTVAGRERGIGVVLSRHRGSQFSARTEHDRYVLQLDGGYRRWDGPGKRARTKYAFRVLSRKSIPVEQNE
ncbi:MAG TPA: hypothetical protein VMP01_28625 [Pirellulaceae bacterium]|nr:hypothetical protein [Pirellulaceae bacterium]